MKLHVVVKFIKIGILIIALVVPSLIYIFLKSFGDNKFTIPVFYEKGIAIEGCSNDSTQHYVEFESYSLGGVQIFYFAQWVNNQEFFRQCERINSKWPDVLFTAISDTIVTNSLGNVLLVASQEHLYEVANCMLVIGQDHLINDPLFNQLILVDSNKKIRGYYTGNELEEIDRLDIELDILMRENN